MHFFTSIGDYFENEIFTYVSHCSDANCPEAGERTYVVAFSCWCKFLNVFILTSFFLCARDMHGVCKRECFLYILFYWRFILSQCFVQS